MGTSPLDALAQHTRSMHATSQKICFDPKKWKNDNLSTKFTWNCKSYSHTMTRCTSTKVGKKKTNLHCYTYNHHRNNLRMFMQQCGKAHATELEEREREKKKKPRVPIHNTSLFFYRKSCSTNINKRNNTKRFTYVRSLAVMSTTKLTGATHNRHVVTSEG